jgi:elongation factor Ts
MSTTITAEDVKSLRERTGLPMMDCKKALAEANGDPEKAIEILRKRGLAVMATRTDRVTDFGRFGLFVGTGRKSGAIVELKCESAPVTQNEEFITFANALAEQLATGPGASTADELLDQSCPGQPGKKCREIKDDMFNRIREVFNIGRMKRFDTATGGYSHNAGTISGVLLSVSGGDDTTCKDIAMHVAAMRPKSLCISDLEPALVDKEREILREAARKEGKPENILDKMVEGRLRNFYAERVLLEQPFVKDDKLTVGAFAQSKGLKILDYVHWELGKE